MKKYLLVLAIFLMLLSISCGSGGPFSGSGNTQTVSFDMSDTNGWVKCNNAKLEEHNFLVVGSCRTENCTWFCGSGYKNANGSYVFIHFKNCGTGWSIDSDNIREGICN